VADYAITGLTGLGLAIPTFWLGFMLILVFAIAFRWFPSSGFARSSGPGAYISHLVLPTVTLAIPQGCELARFVKSGLVDILKHDYVRTAKAKGISGARLLFHHELRNALVSIATVIGLNVGRLLGGAVIIESVFAWPGVGRLLLEAILNRDYAVVQGGLLVFIVLFMAVNLVTDVLYTALDPRIQLGGGTGV
jgi:ABC-type dipeptide/oligopeptide/nickel transport system permease component